MKDWRDFENLPTVKLIEIIKSRSENDNSNAQKAFHAFYFRFLPKISKKCEIICSNWDFDPVEAVLVVEQTFKRFYKYPKFDISKTNKTDIDKAVLFYLFAIARNVLVDIRKEKVGINVSPYNGDEKIVLDFPNEMLEKEEQIIEVNQKRFEIVKKALSSLSEKHKIIYLTYSQHEQHGFKLPRQLLLQLRKKLNISQNTIRSYKNEAKNRVEEYLKLYELKKEDG